MFARRHFVMIAEIIAAMPSHAATLRTARASTARAFADTFKASNPRFDRERFLAACKVEAGE